MTRDEVKEKILKNYDVLSNRTLQQLLCEISVCPKTDMCTICCNRLDFSEMTKEEQSNRLKEVRQKYFSICYLCANRHTCLRCIQNGVFDDRYNAPAVFSCKDFVGD